MSLKHCLCGFLPSILDDSPEVITGIVDDARKWAKEFLESRREKEQNGFRTGEWTRRYSSRHFRDVRNLEAIRSGRRTDRTDGGDDGVWREALAAYAVCMADRHSLMFGRDARDGARRRIIQSRISQSAWPGRFDDFGKKLMAELDAQSAFDFRFWSPFACGGNDYARYLDGDESTHGSSMSLATLNRDREFLCDLYANICQPSPGVRLLAYADFEDILREPPRRDVLRWRQDGCAGLEGEISWGNGNVERLKMYLDEAMRLRHCEGGAESGRVRVVACFLASAFHRLGGRARDSWKNDGKGWEAYCNEIITGFSRLYGVPLQDAVDEILTRLKEPFIGNGDEVLLAYLGKRHSLDDVHWFASYLEELIEDSGNVDTELFHTVL